MAFENHSQPFSALDRMSPEQLQQFGKIRSAIAELMVPVAMDGLAIAKEMAELDDVTAPTERYDLLSEVSVLVHRQTDQKEAYAQRFDEFSHLFADRAQYLGIYNNQMPSLIRAAVRDAHWAGVSAAARLEQEGRRGEAHEIIPRSVGLLAISRADKRHLEELRQEIGDPIRTAFLDIDPSPPEGDQVSFTQEGLAIIESYPSKMHGCPAYMLENPEPGTLGDNLLHAYWNKTSAYAFSPSSQNS